MPFEIVRNDITAVNVDAIVNSANPLPQIGAGVDAHIHRMAGPELLTARQQIGTLPVGHAAITPGFRLPAKYVIHTAAPSWDGGSHGEAKKLEMCYLFSLDLAHRNGCKSVAFPLLAAGNLQFPKPLALEIALKSIRSFLKYADMQVILVVFDRDVFQLSEGLHRRVQSFINENQVRRTLFREYDLDKASSSESASRELSFRRRERREEHHAASSPTMAPSAEPRSNRAPAPKRSGLFPPSAPSPKLRLADMMKKMDAGFSETLLKLIDSTGKKDSDIYNKANVSRQHFSKIRNDPEYKPTKATAVAFAMALELDLAQTRDLIGRAGFALTESSKFDLIIMFFIQERNYDLYEINATLFEFDQPLLGTKNVT